MLSELLLGLLLLHAAKASCPAGTIYESDFNKCYKFVNEPLSFLESEQSCQAIGGHLVTLANAFENGYVAGIASALGAPTKFWMGANLLRTSSWTWMGNETFAFNNWAASQPSNPTTNQCGAVRSQDNHWTAEVCNSALPFVCAVSANTTAEQCPATTCPNCPACTTTTTSEHGPLTTCPTTPVPCGGLVCSDGYTMYPGTCRCYKYYNFGIITSYTAAQTKCESENGALAKITSSQLNDFLHNTVRTASIFPWIGLNCSSSSISSCLWQDGSNATGYSNFAPGQPSGKFQSVYIGGTLWYTGGDNIGAAICEKAPDGNQAY